MIIYLKTKLKVKYKMKVLMLPVKIDFYADRLLKDFKKEGKVGILGSVHFLHLLEKVKEKIPGSVVLGQSVGCNASNALKENVNSYLFIGSNNFHPEEIAKITKKPVYVASPFTNTITKLEIKDNDKRIKGKQLMYLNAKNIGILVSTKSGQQRLNKALKLKGRIFLFNTLRENELENFPEIDCWINTACSRIEGKRIINLNDIPT